MINLLWLEAKKMKHRKIFLMVILLVIVQFVWGFSAEIKYINGDYNDRIGHSWENLLYLFSSMNALLFPILIAVIVSRICDNEHKGSMLKMILVTKTADKIYLTKFLYIILIIGFISLVQTVGITVFGLICKLPKPLPLAMILINGMALFVTSIPVIALQLWFSMLIENQAFSLTVGLIGGFLGMMTQFFPQSISKFIIWFYYVQLSCVLPGRMGCRFVINPVSFFTYVTIVFIGIVLFFFGQICFSRKEM